MTVSEIRTKYTRVGVTGLANLSIQSGFVIWRYINPLYCTSPRLAT